MFIEPKLDRGWIEVISGSMFSGKTEELIRRVNRARLANISIIVFKPEIDVRYHPEKIVSHQGNGLGSIPVHSSEEIWKHYTNQDMVAIDEGQFFDANLPDVVNELANMKVRVVIAGLDMDFRGQPFGPMPALMSMAEYVTKIHAICRRCGDIASHTFKRVQNEQTVEVGQNELYEALCRSCYREAMADARDQLRMDL